MNFVNILLGSLLLLLGIIVLIISIKGYKNENDRFGGSVQMFFGSLSLLIGGIIMLIREIF